MRLAPALILPLAAAILGSASHAFAQGKGDNGITMGYPLSVGLVTRISDRLALRPELQLSWTTSETESPFQATGVDSTVIGVGISALIYIGDVDKLRTYICPRYVFGRTSITTQSPFGDSSENSVKSHTLIGSFGAQYALHDRFGVFGEVGVGVTGDRRRSSFTPTSTEMTTVNTRTGVGLVFYF